MSRGAPQLDDGTFLFVLGAGAAAAAGAAAYTAGHAAALLTTGQPAHATVGPVPTVLLGLIKGPAAVYDPPPPAWLYYLLAVVLVVVLARLLLWAGKRLDAFGGAGGAQWGGTRIERKLSAPNPPERRRNRITAGRGVKTKKIVAAEPNISTVVFGMPGSGKTSGLLLPNAAEWAGPAVITTAKASDLDEIYARRAALGPVWVIAPAGAPGRTTHRTSQVDYCHDARAADRMAAWMAEASASGDDKRSAPWIDQAKSVLKGILLAAHLSGGGTPALRRWISLGKDAVDHVRPVLLEHGYTDVAEDYASPWLRLHDDGVGSIQFSLNVLARMYADEQVRETTSGTDWTVEELLDLNGTVCLIAPPADAERFAPLLTAIIASIIHGAEQRYNTTGRALDPALGLFIDEAGNALRYPRLPHVLTTGRGMGINLLTVWHDLSQLRTTLGREKAATVLSASGMRMLLPGCGDLETLDYFSRLLGRTEVQRTSHGRSRGEYSTNTQAVDQELAPVDRLQQLADYTAVAQYTNNPAIKVRMRRTWAERDLKRYLTSAPAPAAEKPRVDLTKEAADV